VSFIKDVKHTKTVAAKTALKSTARMMRSESFMLMYLYFDHSINNYEDARASLQAGSSSITPSSHSLKLVGH